jgi:hypothetical protein
MAVMIIKLFSVNRIIRVSCAIRIIFSQKIFKVISVVRITT